MRKNAPGGGGAPEVRNLAGSDVFEMSGPVKTLLTASCAGSLVIAAFSAALGWWATFATGLAVGASALPGFWALKRGNAPLALMPFLLTSLIGILYAAFKAGGLYDIGLSVLPVLIVVVALLLDRRLLILFTAVALTVTVGLVSIRYWLDRPHRPGDTTLGDMVIFVVACTVTATVAELLSMRLKEGFRLVRESEARYREIFENVQDAYFELKPDGELIEMSPAGVAQFGAAQGAASGDHFFAIHASGPDERALLDQIKQEGRVDNYPMTLRGREGEQRNVLVSASIEAGRGERIIGSVRDITERRQLEENLAQARKMDSIGMLAGGIAHDFNNYLTVINGYAEMAMAAASKADPFLRGHLSEIRKAGERASELTYQLVAFSRKQVSELRPGDLAALVEEVSSMLERVIGEHIVLRLELYDRPALVLADVTQLSRCLVNLAANARDAMPDGGEIVVQVYAAALTERSCAGRAGAFPGEFVLLSFADTGLGMDEETRRRIFEPFFTTKQPGQGTGLGLSTVYGIVKQCGGWVEVSSAVGKGCEIRVYLPRTHARPGEEAGGSPRDSSGDGQGTILLVEDSEEVRRLSAAILAGGGYRILEATDGEEALTVAGQFKGTIDLLITDIVMPRLSGRSLAKELSQQRPGLRVLFVSGYAGEAAGLEQQPAAGSRFLAKPFTPASLLEKARECLQ